MKYLIIFISILVQCISAKAQKIEELTDDKQTIRWNLPQEELNRRFIVENKAWKALKNPTGASLQITIFPDTLYAGEPIEVHYPLSINRTAVVEFYDCRGKRPKKMETRRTANSMRGSAVFRVTFDEPGDYEVRAFEEEALAIYSDPDLYLSRQKITVHDRKSPPKE